MKTAWRCSIASHDAVFLSETAPHCLHPVADYVCLFEMVPANLPEVTRRSDGAYTAGPPPDGRSVGEHLDELAAGRKP